MPKLANNTRITINRKKEGESPSTTAHQQSIMSLNERTSTIQSIKSPQKSSRNLQASKLGQLSPSKATKNGSLEKADQGLEALREAFALDSSVPNKLKSRDQINEEKELMKAIKRAHER